MVKYIFVLFFLAACEPIHKAKMYTRHYILGTPLEVPEEVTPIPEVKDYSKEAEAIVQITPQKKVYNLFNGYLTNPEVALKNLLIAELSKAETIFKVDDNELISFFNRFTSMVQDQNQDVIEISAIAYGHLDGANKEAAGLVLALGLDYMLPKTIEFYYKNKKENTCSFANILTKNLENEQKFSLYKARRDALLEYANNETFPAHYKLLALECEKMLQLELVKFTMKKNLPPVEETPMVEEAPPIPPSENDVAPSAKAP
jgi:hypothetical protein